MSFPFLEGKMTINTLKTPGQTFKKFLYWKKDDDDKSVGSWAVIRMPQNIRWLSGGS